MTLKPSHAAALEADSPLLTPNDTGNCSASDAHQEEARARLEAIGREASGLFEAFARFPEARRGVIAKTAARYWLAKALRRRMAEGCDELASQILRTEAGRVMLRVEELLLRLDAVEAHNDEVVRFLRKQLVTRLNAQLGEMEKFMHKAQRLVAFQAEKDAAARDILNRSSPKKKPLMSASEAVALGVEEILGSTGLLPAPLHPLASTTSPHREAEMRRPRSSSTSTSSVSSQETSTSTPERTSSSQARPTHLEPKTNSPTTTSSTTEVESPTSKTTKHQTTPIPTPPREGCNSRGSSEEEKEPLAEPEYTVQDRKHAVIITVRDEEARRCEIELRGRDGNLLSVRVPGRKRVQFALDPERLSVQQATKELLGRNVLQIVLPKRRLAAAVPSYVLRGWPRF